jgi:hypothetical protein
VFLKPFVEYFRQVQTVIGQLHDAYIEVYEEELLAATRANLRIRIRFLNQSLLAGWSSNPCTTEGPPPEAEHLFICRYLPAKEKNGSLCSLW